MEKYKKKAATMKQRRKNAMREFKTNDVYLFKSRILKTKVNKTMQSRRACCMRRLLTTHRHALLHVNARRFKKKYRNKGLYACP